MYKRFSAELLEINPTLLTLLTLFLSKKVRSENTVLAGTLLGPVIKTDILG